MRALPIIGLVVLTGCLPVSPPRPTPVPGGVGQLEIHALAGPVCPVESEPPDPECAPRPVPRASVFVQPGDGRDILVAQATTDARGVAVVDLPAGEYVVLGGDVEGLMAGPQAVRVLVTAHDTTTVELAWDTGIR